jgi:lysophospholipase L1-like esterase
MSRIKQGELLRRRSNINLPSVQGPLCALVLLSTVTSAAQFRTLVLEGIQLDARNQPGTVLVRGQAVLHAGQTLILSTTKGYEGEPLAQPRRPQVTFLSDGKTSLTIEAGARLVVEGQPGQLINFVTEPVDPEVKPVMTLADAAKTELTGASFINIALRVEGTGHSLSDVSVQFAGDQPAFTFAGTQGTFDHLFAHHSTWGFSFEPFDGQTCHVVIRDSMIRGCAKSTGRHDPEPSTYVSGGSVRSIAASEGGKHRVEFQRVDWDPFWDDLNSVELRASGQRPRIVAMGDSIAQGCCRYVNFWNYLDGNDDIEHSWPYQLQLRVPEYFVISRGEGGYLTTQMMARLPAIIEKIKPKYCYIGGGTNDIFRTNFTADQIVRNYKAMWLKLKRAGIVPIQLAITPETVHPELQARIKEANALLKDTAERESVRFEDVYSLLVSPTGSNLDPAYDPGDGLHPNKLGYQKMAQLLYIPPPQNARTSDQNASRKR